jgi:hypothetical protein
MRMVTCNIASVLLLNDEEVKENNLILIKNCTMVKVLERKQNFYSSIVWPSCLKKFLLSDELGNVLLGYFYEIDHKMPLIDQQERVRVIGVFQKEENSFGDPCVFHCYKIAKNE